MVHLDIEQGSPEWHQLRLGKLTASRAHDAFYRLKTKAGFAATRKKYLTELCYERINEVPYPQFVTKPMQFGTENQVIAEDRYAMRFDTPIIKPAFVEHPTIPMAGCSPDGLVGADGFIEIKVPESHTHFETWRTGEINEEYIYQMRWQFACMPERQWCDFVSFDPRIEKPKYQKGQFYRRRIQRSEHQDAITQMEKDALVFLMEVASNESVMRALWLQDDFEEIQEAA